MYAAHFAAGLAIKSRVPKAPTAVLIAGAFLCDFIWIACFATGIEFAVPGHFWDDWSHSLASTLVWATLYGGGVWLVMRRTPGVRFIALAAFVAVLSHFFL